MSTNWFYSDGQQTFGPVSAEQLAAMIQSGQIMASHLILPEGGEEWQTMSSSPFAGYMVPVPVLVVPQARIQISLTDVEYEEEAPQRTRVPSPKIGIAALALVAIGAGAYYLIPLPHRTAIDRIEAESLTGIAASAGTIDLQDMSQWRAANWSEGRQLHWINETPEATLTLPLHVAVTGTSRVRAMLTRANAYGTVEVLLDGEPVYGSPFNLNHWSVTTTGLLDWGVHDLRAGTHKISFKALRGETPTGLHAGIDFIQLEPPIRSDLPLAAGTNLATTARPSASHCWGGDTVTALSDGKEPPSGRSSDTNIPRHTFWDRRGGHEWVQYEWETPQVVQECSVFWWEDASRGGATPLPYFWRILYREDSGAWVPVNAAIPAAKADQWNVVKFPAVRTRAIRLAVQCAMGKTAAILEWKAMAGKVEDIVPRKQPLPDLFLGDLTPLYARVGWHSYRVSQYHEADVRGGNILRFEGKDAEYYLWAHAPSRLEFAIPTGYTRFRATAFGPFHQPSNTRSSGTWQYEVRVDGKVLYNSLELQTYLNYETLIHLDLPPGSRRLTLITKSDDTTADHAFWGNPRFVASDDGTRLPPKLPGKLP